VKNFDAFQCILNVRGIDNKTTANLYRKDKWKKTYQTSLQVGIVK